MILKTAVEPIPANKNQHKLVWHHQFVFWPGLPDSLAIRPAPDDQNCTGGC